MSATHHKDHDSGSVQLHFLNAYTASTGIAPRQMEAHLQRGHRLHAAAIRGAFSTLVGGTWGLIRRAVKGYREQRDIRATERVLRSLSPHMLQDIGIDGHQIPAVARGLELRPDIARSSPDTSVPAEPLQCCLDRAA